MSDRADRLLRRLPELGADLLMVTSLVNVRYLTGYTGSNGVVLLGDGTRTFLTDFRYIEQAAEEVGDAFDRRIVAQELTEGVVDVIGGRRLRLGFEDAHLSIRAHAQLRERLPAGVELVPAGDPVEAMRLVKEPAEIERIARAAELADEALASILERGLIGRSEREVAVALTRAMVDLGAEATSFDPIVAAGPHGALPHAEPRDVEIGPGQLVVIDWGARLDGYCSDCTRTVATGEPGEDARAVYELVREAQRVGLDAVSPGVGGREADAAARAVIDGGGHAEHYGHGLGHGVGLEIHEGPRLSQRSEATLQAGNVVTIEPGVYIPGGFGVRIEDLAVVTETGTRVLTSLPKELTLVG